jgi:hypothetical protein
MLVLWMVLCSLTSGAGNAPGSHVRIPVIYCSDLFHPHDDPDDHFDLASLYAIDELDIKAIILDQGAKQEAKPGRIPVEQLNHLTGRTIPWAIGLSRALTQPADTGRDESGRYQAGVELILNVLQKAPSPVTVICVGSLRDVAAAFNRRPELFMEKVSRLLLFIGDAQGAFREYNVTLDPNAYTRLMSSGLPIYWVPCFDGGLWKNDNGNASYWKASHADLLQGASQPVMNYFIYALLHKTDSDHIGFLHDNQPDSERLKVLSEERNLWCSAVFAFVANRKYVLRDGRYLSVPGRNLRKGEKVVEIFTFHPVKVKVDRTGKETLGDVAGAQVVKRFHIENREIYASAMTSITGELIKDLSSHQPPNK